MGRSQAEERQTGRSREREKVREEEGTYLHGLLSCSNKQITQYHQTTPLPPLTHTRQKRKRGLKSFPTGAAKSESALLLPPL